MTSMIRVLLAAVFVAGIAASAEAQGVLQRLVPNTKSEMTLSFAATVKRAKPSVVNVYALRRARPNPVMEEMMRRYFSGGPSGAPMERVQRSLGSGVIVDASGLIITNHHVIDGADEIRVALSDRREFPAEVVLRDPRSDLAVLRISEAKERLPAIEIANSDEVEVGDLVLAIGDPFGVGQTVTQGIVSATARTRVGISDFQFFIQTDAAINPGNSGGALVDTQGRLVGINTAIFSRSGGSHGIGFAIPSNMARVVIESALAGAKTVRRPYFGADLQPVTQEIAESLNLPRPTGALVASLSANSPAERAGLRAGDVIVSVDNTPVDDPSAVNYRLALRPVGGTANLAVLRGGRNVAVPVKLEPAPERDADEIEIEARSPFSGVKVSNFTPQLASRLRADPTSPGVVVLDVSDGSIAQRVGLRPGDVILAVNSARIDTTRDLERVSRANAREWRITIKRGGQQRTVTIRG